MWGVLLKEWCHLGSFSVAGGVPQVFLTAPSGTVQIPVSAVQLHQVGAEWCSCSGGVLALPLPADALWVWADLVPWVGPILRPGNATQPWVRKSCPLWTGAEKGQCHPGC